LFFCTNRTVNQKPSHLHNRYTVRRGSVSFGRVEVTIPLVHELGNIERPKWWLLEVRENSRRHVVIKSITQLGVEEFTAELGSAITDNKQMLVFVHGYNVTFTKAARQAAQLKFDLGFAGPVLMFSWASLGIPFGYPADEATAGWSVEHCEQLLKLLDGAPGVSAIHIVAHSMGGRIAAAALEKLVYPALHIQGRIQQVVLAAPDIDADTLLQIAPAVRKNASRVTVYGSDSDWAIRASRLFHWAHRAGEGGTRIIVHDAFDSIDATEAGTGHLGHSYVTDSSSVLGDIHTLIRSNPEPGERFGLRKTPIGAWEFIFRKHG
jgi:esterase/lipase superfamily enzyme